MSLNEAIERVFDSGNADRSGENLQLLADFREGLNRGEVQAIEPCEERWRVNVWVRKGILLHALLGLVSEYSEGPGPSFELDTMPLRRFRSEDRVRIAQGRSAIRDGSYLGPQVSCLPYVFVNMGAWIGTGTILDSHTSIGFCAHIGERVHVGPGTHIGGVLQPLDQLPVILGDDVVVGGNCGIYEGVCIGKGAVLGAGTILTGSTRVFDLKKQRLFSRSSEQPLFVPPNAVLVPGSRLIAGQYAGSGLMLQVAVLIGYRDEPDLPEDVMAGLLG